MSIEREATVNAAIREHPSFPCLKFMHESTDCCGVHAPFMLIEALKGNNIIDAASNDLSKLSEEQRPALVKKIAEIHVSQSVSVFTMLDGIRT